MDRLSDLDSFVDLPDFLRPPIQDRELFVVVPVCLSLMNLVCFDSVVLSTGARSVGLSLLES